MGVVIIDYGSGNLHSVYESVLSVAKQSVTVVSEAKALEGADHIILPGVGSFKSCMAGLSALPGMVDMLEMRVLEQKTPFLGICVGMQLLCDFGNEHGRTPGLGWIKGEVRALEPNNPQLKIPHMGWNTITFKEGHPLFKGLTQEVDVYFVHSYHLDVEEDKVLATTEYGGNIVAAVGYDHIMATQFHPEKSQKAGLTMLQNFVEL